MPIAPKPRLELRVDDHPEVRRRLLAAVLRHCPAWLRDDAEDIVHQAMLRLHEGSAEVVNATYLDRVAYCATIDALRHRRAQRLVLGADPPEPPSRAPGDDPSRVADSRALGEAIRDCVARLVETRRRAVGLHLEGHSGAEIARLLDLPAKTVENLVYRGLEGLRACLAAKGMTP